jgi:hypothetical protein
VSDTAAQVSIQRDLRGIIGLQTTQYTNGRVACQ